MLLRETRDSDFTNTRHSMSKVYLGCISQTSDVDESLVNVSYINTIAIAKYHNNHVLS